MRPVNRVCNDRTTEIRLIFGKAYFLEEDQETTQENNLFQFSICHMIATRFPEGYIMELLGSHIFGFLG